MRRTGPFLILLLIIGAASWYLVANHKTPRDQRPLADLNAKSVPALKAEFNRNAASLRVILLLSPT
jgi:hypothetical protein